MRNSKGKIARYCLAMAVVFAFFCVSQAPADTITLIENSLFMMRDTCGANDVFWSEGDKFYFGAFIDGGSSGTMTGATYPATGFTVPPAPANPYSINPWLACNTTPYNASQIPGNWIVNFEKEGFDPLEVTAPSLVGAETPVAFPTTVTLSGSGVTPTISWNVQEAPNGVRIIIFDKNSLTEGGTPDAIHTFSLPGDTTSYTLPTVLSTGGSIEEGGNYVIMLQLLETRDDLEPYWNSNVLKRSSSFFSFTPLTGDSPPDVVLPTVSEGVYNFSIDSVSPDTITYIDPFVATGYDYAIGGGDPYFASVLLPNVGDGVFTLEFYLGTILTTWEVNAGEQIFFGGDGVSAFSVTGIEEYAGLDPNDVTAFITGLTFMSEGRFTGTMTPRTVFVPDGNPVPEPGTIILLSIGLFGIISLRKKVMKKNN